MRIFLISNMYPSHQDPLFGVFVKNFKTELEKQDVVFNRVSLIKGKTNSRLKKVSNYIKHYFNSIKNSFHNDYDLIYIHYLTHHIPLLFLLIFKKTPIVINVHGSDVVGLLEHKTINLIAKRLLRRIDALVVPTSHFKKLISEQYSFLNSNQIIVSPSGGIDKDVFYIKDSPKHRSLRIGLISRLNEKKGWRTFLDALVLLKKEIEFKAIIAGKGPDEDKILDYIEANNLVDTVDFLGLVNQNELINVYNSLDIYIFPTEQDSLGLTGLEAMACGVPVIASNIQEGPGTYVKHGVNGYLFDLKDSNSLFKYIKSYVLLSDADKNKMKQAAIATSKMYERSMVASRLKEHLTKLL